MTADIAVLGLAVMGRNLALNFADSGFDVAVYNRTTEKMTAFISDEIGDLPVEGFEKIEDLVAGLNRPKVLMLMVAAGDPVDAVLDELLPLLEKGDVVIDGGNSQYTDTVRRAESLADHGINYVGAGVSGGELGARYGPSIMPGGTAEAWPVVRELLQAAAAKTEDGTPCCDWIGPGGAGHFVKMVHNGIEYGDMQVIAEAYDLMKAMGLSNQALVDTFTQWNDGVLDSYLIEITSAVLAYEDPDAAADAEALVDRIVDSAAQKGTGRWTAIGALEAGQPLTLVAESVFARVLSSFRDQRQTASEALPGPDRSLAPEAVALDDIRDAVYASKIVSYAQGFMFLRSASEANEWSLDLGRIASLWREGCIIRAAFLDDITAAFQRDPELVNLLFDQFFVSALEQVQGGWRRTVAAAVEAGVPVPAYSSALAFYDGYRSARLPANLIQAQRDYFGAHTYRLLGDDTETSHHTDWTVTG